MTFASTHDAHRVPDRHGLSIACCGGANGAKTPTTENRFRDRRLRPLGHPPGVSVPVAPGTAHVAAPEELYRGSLGSLSRPTEELLDSGGRRRGLLRAAYAALATSIRLEPPYTAWAMG